MASLAKLQKRVAELQESVRKLTEQLTHDTPQDPETYTALLQVSVILHKEESAIVETDVEFPAWYRPVTNDIIVRLFGFPPVPVSAVLFDMDKSTFVITLPRALWDITHTLEEWLALHPGWREAEVPFIETRKVSENGGSESADSDSS